MRRLAFWLLPLALAACSDTMQTEFADMRAPEAIAMKTRGWIPGFVPDDTTHILEKHDLDTNYGITTFTTDALRARSLFKDALIKWSLTKAQAVLMDFRDAFPQPLWREVRKKRLGKTRKWPACDRACFNQCVLKSQGMKATVRGGTDCRPDLSFWPRKYRKRLRTLFRKEDVTIYRLEDDLFNTIWYVVLDEDDGFTYLSSRPFLPLEDPDFK